MIAEIEADLTPREQIARAIAWHHFGIAWHHMERQSHDDVFAMVDRALAETPTDPAIRYYTRVSGWTADKRPGAVVEVEGHVELAEALEAARATVAMGDGEFVTVTHMVATKVLSQWRGNHLPKLATIGPNFIKVEDDAELEAVRLYDAYGEYDTSYSYSAHGSRGAARVQAVRTARYLAEQREIEWGSNW